MERFPSARRAPYVLAAAVLVLALFAVAMVVHAWINGHGAQTIQSQKHGLHVSGNRLVDTAGNPVRLYGVNKSGTEYACIQGWGIFSGSSDEASIQHLVSNHVHVVRVPLNEDCWLGINGVKPEYAGANYQQAIRDYVQRLHAHGLYAILDLHWAAPGTSPATDIIPMPDADHSVTFWQQIAAAYKDQPNVLFDLYNEPHDVSWECWRSGGLACAESVDYAVAGMQQLVYAIRGEGAHNVILVGGLAWANDLSEWLIYAPHDPDGNLMAAWHIYQGNPCDTEECWNAQVAPVAEAVPLFAGEYCGCGSQPFNTDFGDALIAWLDAHHASYAAWTWNNFGGNTSLLEDEEATQLTPYGTWVTRHYADLDARAAPPPAP